MQCVDVALDQPRKRRDALAERRAFDLRPGGEEGLHQGAVARQPLGIARRDLVEMGQSEAAEPLVGVRLRRSNSSFRRQIRSASAGSARIQPHLRPLRPYTLVRLLVLTNASPRWTAERAPRPGVEIDLVDQHPHAEIADPPQRRLVGEGGGGLCRLASRISRVRGPILAFDLVGIEPEPVLGAPRGSLDLGAAEARGGEHRLVGRLLDQHLVAGLDQSGERQHVGHGGAVGHHHPLGIDALLVGDRPAQRRVAIVAGAVELEVGDRDRQAVEPEMRHLARTERIAHRRLVLRPVHIFGLQRASGHGRRLSQ